jgi:hypothetical protein
VGILYEGYARVRSDKLPPPPGGESLKVCLVRSVPIGMRAVNIRAYL